MSPARIGTLVGLELRQRVRSAGWYVLLGVFFVVLGLVFWGATAMFATANAPGVGVYSVVVLTVLLLVVFITPTFSGNALNGDRDTATLAPVQVTRATTSEILIAKLMAAWATGLAFLVLAIPFLVSALIIGAVKPVPDSWAVLGSQPERIPLDPWTLVISLLVLIAEIGVVSAIGVGLSSVIARPLFSVASTYLVVMLLVVGTLIAFVIGGMAVRSEVTETTRYPTNGLPLCSELPSDVQGEVECREGAQAELECSEWSTVTREIPRFDHVWWVLAANPFVVLADATPTHYDARGYPIDMFGQIKTGVRGAQIPPEPEVVRDGCAATGQNDPSPREQVENTVPSWFVGLGIQVVAAAGLMVWGWSRTRTPSRRTPPGTRIA